MKDAGLLLQWLGAPCGCHCKHCLLRGGLIASSVPYRIARAVTERFLRWRDDHCEPTFVIDLAAGYCIDFPQLHDYLSFRRDNRMPASDSVQINGIGFRSALELNRFLGGLKERGVTRVGMSFYGTPASHDRFAGRPGDFQFLLTIATIAAEAGMERFETIFLHKESVFDMQELLDTLDRIPSLGGRSIEPWDYRGRGKDLEESRPSSADARNLPKIAAPYFNSRKYRSEAALAAEIRSGRLPTRTRRFFLVSIWPDSVHSLQSEECGRIMDGLRRMHDRFLKETPPLAQLASMYGRGDEERIYSIRDLEWKWHDAFLRDNPGLVRDLAFNDLTSGALLK